MSRSRAAGLLALCADRRRARRAALRDHGENRGGVRDEDWFEQRAGELDEAAGVLGIADVMLLDYRDGFLPWAATCRIASRRRSGGFARMRS
jgi:LmbE family N-acetylglucosaminyl deacetylase